MHDFSALISELTTCCQHCLFPTSWPLANPPGNVTAFCFLGTSSVSLACAFCLLLAVRRFDIVTYLFESVVLKLPCDLISQEVIACYPAYIHSAPLKRISIAESCEKLSELIKQTPCESQCLPVPVTEDTHLITCLLHPAACPKPLPPFPEEKDVILIFCLTLVIH